MNIPIGILGSGGLVEVSQSPRFVFRFLQRIALVAVLVGSASAQVSITSQPVSITVPAGQTASFSVTVTTSGTPTYQWRRRGYTIPGANQSTLVLPTVSQGENDLYDVVVTSGGAATTSQPARLLVTLPSYPNAVTFDPARSIRLEGVDGGSLTAQAALPDGSYYLAGSFSSVSGQKSHDIVHVSADGVVDPKFSPPTFDSLPSSIALQSDGKLVIGGFFQNVGGVPTRGIVRLNPDGSRDTTFNVGAGFSNLGTARVLVGPGDTIYAIGLGELGSYQGSASLHFLARLTSAGALDTTFTFPVLSESNFLGAAIGPTGLIYLQGSFNRVNGTTRNRLVRLLPSGAVDPSFDPGSGPSSPTSNGLINTTVPLSNGQVVIGGDFTSYNGTTVGHIARLNADGSLDRSFVNGLGFSNQINFIVELPGNNLFVGPAGAAFNGFPTSSAMRLTPNGSVDSTFAYQLPFRPDFLSVLPGNRLLVSGASIDVGIRPGVFILDPNGTTSSASRPALLFPSRGRLLTYLPGGKILLAGDFSYADGVPVPYLIRLNADFTRDTTFPRGPGPSSLVVTGAVQPDGKIILFTYTGMMRLNADGSTDTTFSSIAPGGYVFSAPPVVLSDGRIFVSYPLSFWNVSPVSNGFFILEPDGTRATSHPLLPGPPAGSKINGALLLPNGELLVTGSFSSWNGIACAKAVRLRVDGSVDTAFNFDPTFAPTNREPHIAPDGPAAQRDGRVIAMSDQASPVLARFNIDGSRDPAYGGTQTALFGSGRLLIQPDDRLIMMGQSATYVGVSQPIFYTRFTTDGMVDPSFVVEGSGFWMTAMLTDSGELLTSDFASGYLQRYRVSSPPRIDVQPAGQIVIAGTGTTLRVTASSTLPLTYQWMKNGGAIAGATNSILSLDGVSAATAGSYTVAVTSAAGTTTSAAAAVTVAPRPVEGVYFGAVQDGGRGRFALYIRNDGTGVFISFARSGVFTNLAFTVDASRHFHFTPAVAPTDAATDPVVDGALAFDGSVTGSIIALAFSAPPAISSGPGTFTGFYRALAAGSDIAAYMIVAPDNTFYHVVSGFTADAGQGTLDVSGSFAITTIGAAPFTGAVEAGAIRWSATWAPPVQGVSTIRFSGADDDRRTDVEKLINISTRSTVSAGGGAFTTGFVVAGDQSKPVLVRAIGPSLGLFHVPDALPAAHLEVFRGSTLIAIGNDWSLAGNAAQVGATASRVGAFALPAGSRDAAVLLTLTPGSYSAVVSGQDQASGTALAEIYDATDGAAPKNQRVINISTLARAGDTALVAGFVISGSVPKRMLVRGVGPALAAFGVADRLPRPQVKVYSGTTVLVQNAGWTTAADPGALSAAATQVGAFAFPSGSADAALIVNLAPGQYTAEVSSLDGASGIALVEIYEVP